MAENDKLELLAELEHEQWRYWARQLIAEVSPERAKRWRSRMVSYASLPDEAKEQDRVWARAALESLSAAVLTLPTVAKEELPVFRGQIRGAMVRQASDEALGNALEIVSVGYTKAVHKGDSPGPWINSGRYLLDELWARGLVVPQGELARKVAEETIGTYAAFRVDEESGQQLVAWCETQGIVNIVPADKMHCTTVHSIKPIPDYQPSQWTIKLDPITYHLGMLGRDGALVLFFENQHVREQHSESKKLGALWEYEGFTPHITLSYDARGSRFRGPPDFPITLGPEYMEELRVAWAIEEGMRQADSSSNVHKAQPSVGDVHVPSTRRRGKYKITNTTGAIKFEFYPEEGNGYAD